MAPSRLSARSSGSMLSKLISLVVLVVAEVTAVLGQSTSGMWTPPPAGPTSTWSPGSTSVPQVANPMVVDLAKEAGRYSPPNPYGAPTSQQSQWYVDNHPALWNLSPGVRDSLIRGGAGSALGGPYLPDGRTNPFYQNGTVTPNWYLPSTWTSPVMNWQGVQPNGYLASPTAGSYNPSYTIPSYNPSSFVRSTPISAYRPPPLAPKNEPDWSQQTTSQKGDLATSFPRARVEELPVGPRPIDMAKAIENNQRALALHEAAGDKLGEAIDRVELARLFVQDNQPEAAFVYLSTAEPLAKVSGDPHLRMDVSRIKAAAYLATGEFERSIRGIRTGDCPARLSQS